MILGIFLLAAANAAVALGAHEILLRVRTDRSSVDLVLFLTCRLLLISAIVLVAGVTQTLNPIVLGLAAAAGIAILLYSKAHARLPAIRLFASDKWIASLIGLVLLRLLAQVWFFAPYNGDVASYHLPKIAEWVRSGGFSRELGVDSHATFPAGFELVETWWVIFLKHDIVIEMAGVEFLILAFAGVYAIADRFGFDQRSALLAAILYTMTPGLHLSSTSCLNDVPVAALITATATLVIWHVPLPLTLLPLFLGTGVKPSFEYALPGLFVLWFMMRKEPTVGKGLVKPRWAWATAALAFLVGTYWYIRNAAWYGSPIYPMGASGIVEVSGTTTVQFGPNLNSIYSNAIALLDNRILDRGHPQSALLTEISGWGPLPLACGILAIVPMLRAEIQFRRLFIGYVISLASVFLLVRHDPWFLRFALFFPAVFCIAVVRLATSFRPSLAILIAVMVLQFLMTMLPGELPLSKARVLAEQPWRSRTAGLLYDVEPTSQGPAPLKLDRRKG